MFSSVASLVVAACLCAAARAQGTVTGAAMPGTMEDTFTMPRSNFTDEASGCTMLMKGCTGELMTFSHEVAGTITVQDDCTFYIDGWQFDGEGPAVEWWGAKQVAAAPAGEFPYDPEYMANPQKIGELGAPGSYQTGDSEVVVRLGKDDTGKQILLSDDLNYISVWCEDYAVDFGSAALECDGAEAPGAAAAAPQAGPAGEQPGVGTTGGAGGGGGTQEAEVGVDENAPDEVPATDDVLGEFGADDVAMPGDDISRSASLTASALAVGGALLAAWL